MQTGSRRLIYHSNENITKRRKESVFSVIKKASLRPKCNHPAVDKIETFQAPEALYSRRRLAPLSIISIIHWTSVSTAAGPAIDR